MDTGPGVVDGEALRPDRPAHDIDTRLHQENGYSTGFFALCTCGWTSVLHPLNRRGLALLDGYKHLQDVKGTAA